VKLIFKTLKYLVISAKRKLNATWRLKTPIFKEEIFAESVIELFDESNI
jgi:hypothetical protein